MIPNGLKPLTQEDHQKNAPYSVGALFALTLKDVPASYKPVYPKEWILNQGEYEPWNDECLGCAISFALSLLNGYRIDPHLLWALARMRSGATLDDFGATTRDGADTIRKQGALRFEDSPYSFKDGRNTIADITNWDLSKLLIRALPQLCGSVLWIKPQNGMDAFDVFRASITKLNAIYGKKHAAVFGTIWGWPEELVRYDTLPEGETGHALCVFGWYDNDYGVAAQSYGLNTGDQGEIQLHRKIINYYAEVFGMFIPIDASQEEVKAAIARGGRLDDSLLANVRKTFLLRMKQILEQIILLTQKTTKGISDWSKEDL